MIDPLFTALYLVAAWLNPCLNKQIRFMAAQIRFLKADLERHGVTYVVLLPEEKQELIRLGADLDNKVKDLFFINTMGTYRRWLRNERNGIGQKRPGRLRTLSQEVVELIIRLAKENTEWGYTRIAGECKKLGHIVSDSSIFRILRRRGIQPSPDKGRKKHVPIGIWTKFVELHMDTTIAMDYFTCKLITIRGVFLAHSLVFLHHATRRVWISYPTLNPDEDWSIRQLKGACWWFEDQGIEPRYMIRDRDGKYSEKFDSVVKDLTNNKRGVVKTSRGAPDMNAYVESMIGHMKAECHNYFWLFRSLDQLGRANLAYMRYHNAYRPHQGKENSVLTSPQAQAPPAGPIIRMDLLGGLLHHYYREAS